MWNYYFVVPVFLHLPWAQEEPMNLFCLLSLRETHEPKWNPLPTHKPMVATMSLRKPWSRCWHVSRETHEPKKIFTHEHINWLPQACSRRTHSTMSSIKTHCQPWVQEEPIDWNKGAGRREDDDKGERVKNNNSIKFDGIFPYNMS